MKTVLFYIICMGAGFAIGDTVFKVVSVYAQGGHGTASEEVPRGALDGTNTTFTLNFQPLPWASIHVYVNGLRLHRGNDYTLGGTFNSQLIFTAAATPQPGDVVLADYTY